MPDHYYCQSLTQSTLSSRSQLSATAGKRPAARTVPARTHRRHLNLVPVLDRIEALLFVAFHAGEMHHLLVGCSEPAPILSRRICRAFRFLANTLWTFLLLIHSFIFYCWAEAQRRKCANGTKTPSSVRSSIAFVRQLFAIYTVSNKTTR